MQAESFRVVLVLTLQVSISCTALRAFGMLNPRIYCPALSWTQIRWIGQLRVCQHRDHLRSGPEACTSRSGLWNLHLKPQLRMHLCLLHLQLLQHHLVARSHQLRSYPTEFEIHPRAPGCQLLYVMHLKNPSLLPARTTFVHLLWPAQTTAWLLLPAISTYAACEGQSFSQTAPGSDPQQNAQHAIWSHTLQVSLETSGFAQTLVQRQAACHGGQARLHAVPALQGLNASTCKRVRNII